MKKLSLLLTMLALCVALGLASTPTVANCIPAKTGANAAYPNYAYIDFGDITADTSHFVGSFWQTSSPGTDYPVTEWLYGVIDYANYWYFYLNLGDARVSGCPAGALTVYIEDMETDKFVQWTVAEGVGPTGGQFNYDFTGAAGGGFVVSGDSPRPRVNSSARVGNSVDMNVTVIDPAGGNWQQGSAGAITGVNLYSIKSNTMPDSNEPSAWTLAGSVTTAGGSTDISVDCTDTATDAWVATGLLVDGQGPVVLSEAVQVECDPTLADPSGNFKVIQRPDKKRTRRDN